MKKMFTTMFVLATLGCALSGASSPTIQPRTSTLNIQKPTIVLIHGAWADGSSWSKVIPILEEKGYAVVAVQNPLSSLADDVAAATRAIDRQTGPVVLVGHSWGGAVITQAGNDSKVAALVYVDAFAPDSGQSVNDLAAPFGTPAWFADLSPDAGGFLWLSNKGVKEFFAQDLPPHVQNQLAATQGPTFNNVFNDKITHAAWHEKPSWWVLGENDRIIDPRLQAGMAAAIKARVTKVKTSHVAMLVEPEKVAAVIEEAAESIQR